MGTISEHDSRKKKVEELREKGINPYPARPQIDKMPEHSRIHFIRENFPTLLKSKKAASIAGRIREKRVHGGSLFVVIEDETGSLQAYIKRDEIGTEQYATWKELIDIGDFVEVKGTAFATRTGEDTIRVEDFQLLTKATLPLPEQWHGLSDVEIRYRKRYLDLLANPSVRENAKLRAKVIQAIRGYLDEHHFTEVETPILQPQAGGALAEPFITHHNALDADLYLRVAPELYLKRLVVGGFERVYEIARCFRNEGIDHSHNPEFTQVEFYYAYIDYTKLMKFTEQMLKNIVQESTGGLRVTYEKNEIDFAPPYPRVTFVDALKEHSGIDITEHPDAKSLGTAAREKGCTVTKKMGRGKIMDELFKAFVRPKIVQPTFIIDHPIELSPLAKRREDDPNFVERFQILLGPGLELCNAFSELNDPEDQYQRFAEQEKLRADGDDETEHMDEDYVEALGYGMPPTAGFGMGIDRLVAVLANSHNLKEIILFPTLKPKNARNR